MQVFLIILFFILGTIFGSFCNVVGFRLANGKSLINPKRSYCPECGNTLKALDLIPILSFIFLKGRCRYCHEKISYFYPVMELFAGILFAVSFYSFGFSYELLLSLVFSVFFVIIIVTDLNYYIIPDEVNIAFAIFIFIINIFIHGFMGALLYLCYGLVLFLAMYLLMRLGNFIFKQESLGGGDIKLCLALGMTLPLLLSFVGIALSALLALPISLYLYLRNHDKKLPFGPFLVAGFFILFLFKIDINTVYSFLLNLWDI